MTKKKIISVILALALVFAFATTALAADPTGTITVDGIETGTVNAYKVIDANFTGNNLTGYSYAVQTWMQSAKYTVDGTTTGAALNVAAITALSNDERAAFYADMLKAIKGGQITGLTMHTLTYNSTDKNYSISGIACGQYLIDVVGGVKLYQPTVVNLAAVYDATSGTYKAAENVKVTLKGSEPEIHKAILEGGNLYQAASAHLGETVTYQLTVDVPKYPSNATATRFVIGDVLSSGLTFTAGSIKVYHDAVTSANLLAETTNYTISYADTDNNANTNEFQVNMIYGSLDKSWTKIYVVFDAKLNSSAVIGNPGNPNEAYLEYNDNPYDNSHYTTDESEEPVVYTYEIDVLKYDGNGTEADTLDGAKFQLWKYTGTDAYSDITKLVETNWTKVGAVASTVDGKISYTHLGEGYYRLEETEAPADFNKLVDYIYITINSIKATDEGGNANRPTGALFNDPKVGTVGIWDEGVANFKGITLPETGGIGTTIFTIIGAALMLGAVVILLARRKAQSQK